MLTPTVISHRTDMGSSPENSIEGIYAALAAGADGIEVDVRASSDGVPMLLHDATLGRTHGDARALASLTSVEARARGVCTLGEAFAAIDGRATLYVEVKERGLAESVARAIVEAGAAAWSWTWAFDPAVAVECQAALPQVPVALNSSPEAAERFGYGSPVHVAVRAGLAGVSLDRRTISRELVQRAHEAGLLVFTWTVNEPRDIEAVLVAGVDGICGDFPTRIRAVIEAATP